MQEPQITYRGMEHSAALDTRIREHIAKLEEHHARITSCHVIIDELDRNYPGLRFNLCHETGELRPFVNIFLNRENIRYLQGLDTLVTPGATVHILQSVAGG